MDQPKSLPEFRTEERERRLNLTIRIRPDLHARLERIKGGDKLRAYDVNRYLELALDMAAEKMEADLAERSA
jgi:hypothetical protein